MTRWATSASVALAERPFSLVLARFISETRPRSAAPAKILSAYSSCLWTGEHLREFIATYLGPTLPDRKTNVELWLGMLNGGPFNGEENVNYRLVTVLEDPKASAFIADVTFQYDNTLKVTLPARSINTFVVVP